VTASRGLRDDGGSGVAGAADDNDLRHGSAFRLNVP
jgi:hypothetical protein